jgi:hypothetical protein
MPEAYELLSRIPGVNHCSITLGIRNAKSGFYKAQIELTAFVPGKLPVLTARTSKGRLHVDFFVLLAT